MCRFVVLQLLLLLAIERGSSLNNIYRERCNDIIDNYCPVQKHDLLNNAYMQRFWKSTLAWMWSNDTVDPCQYINFCQEYQVIISYVYEGSGFNDTVCYLLDVCLAGVESLDLYIETDVQNVSGNAEDTRDMIIEDLVNVCPYANFCGRNATLTIDKDNLMSCCLDCSCEPDCGLINNCCFDYQDTYNVVETLHMQCVKTLIGPGSLFEGNSYHMVDKCFLKNEDSKGFLTDSSCLSFGIRPVSSNLKRIIFINEQCALCNGEMSFSKWNRIASCRTSKNVLVFDDECTIKFAPPVNHREWVKYFFCYPKSSRDCAFEFQTSLFSSACSQVNARHIKQPPHDVYCTLCSHGMYDPSELCDSTGETFEGIGLLPDSFVYVLDTTVLNRENNTIQSSEPQHNECIKHTAENPPDISCRRILCPETMFRLDNTSCVYTVKLWKEADLRIQLSLITNKEDGLLYLTDPANLQIDSIKSSIAKHCNLGNQVFVELFMTSGSVNNLRFIKEIFAQIFVMKTDINPSSFFTKIRNCTNADLIFTLDENDYRFKVRLNKYHDRISHYGEIPQDSGLSLLGRRMKNVYPKYKIEFTLSKLYMCDQIKLLDDEGIWMQDNNSLKIYHNGIVLGNNEFSLSKENDGSASFKVCRDDLMYIAPTISLASTTVPTISIASTTLPTISIASTNKPTELDSMIVTTRATVSTISLASTTVPCYILICWCMLFYMFKTFQIVNNRYLFKT